MRRDYFSTHMATHLRELLKSDPHQIAESVENHDVVVFQRKRRSLPDGQTQDCTLFACCLGCGKHEQCLTNKWRFQHKQWCESCKHPFESECECGRRSQRTQHNEPNRCDEFIERHNESCGGQWSAVRAWFDLKLPAPKLKISNRKTERKQLKPRAGAGSNLSDPVAPVAAPAAPAPPASDETIRALILSVFAEEFESDESDEDDEEDEEVPVPTPLEMLQKLHRTLTLNRKQLVSLNKNMNARVQTLMTAKLASIQSEIHEVEQERIRETDRRNRAERTVEELQSELRQAHRNMQKLSNTNIKLKQQLTDNNIEPDDE